jgi:hypothetical protein
LANKGLTPEAAGDLRFEILRTADGKSISVAGDEGAFLQPGDVLRVVRQARVVTANVRSN